VEVDIWLSSDGVAFSFHDSTLNRASNGVGKISDHTAAQIRQLDGGSWFGKSKKFAGEPIASLADILVAAKGRGRVYVDPKPNMNAALSAATRDAFVEAGVDGSCCWIWGKESIISTFSSYVPTARYLLSINDIRWETESSSYLATYQRLKGRGVEGFSINMNNLKSSKVQKAMPTIRAAGLWVDAYTPNSVADLELAFSLGASAVETDYPGRLAELNARP